MDEDVVINKATVAKIHAQQIDLKNNKPLKAFPVANSEDGEGAKLISADKSWFTFGNPKNKKQPKPDLLLLQIFYSSTKDQEPLRLQLLSKIP